MINLDAAKERWEHIETEFAQTGLELCRVPAVDGKGIALPHPDFWEGKFRRWHGRETNPFEIACYWSHVKALKAFAETGEPHAMICEDDIVPGPDLDAVLDAALSYARCWNVLRLTGLSTGSFVKVAKLHAEYSLCVHTQRLKGAGAYVVDRKAAKAFAAGLLPMKLPYDHAVDREWVFGLTAAAVTPFPISQTGAEFRTQIQQFSQPKLSKTERWAETYPFQVRNEVSRFLARHAWLAYLKLRLWRN